MHSLYYNVYRRTFPISQSLHYGGEKVRKVAVQATKALKSRFLSEEPQARLADLGVIETIGTISTEDSIQSSAAKRETLLLECMKCRNMSKGASMSYV